MTCFSAKRQSTAFLDMRLRAREHARIAAHLYDCASCAAYFEQVGSLRSGLNALPGVATPPRLNTALRVLASRELQAMEEWGGSRWKRTWERWKFRLRLLIDPLTIPATGGVLSSLILFGSLAFAIDNTSQSVDYDVPLISMNDITANLVPVEFRSKEVVLTMSLDGDGHIRDYAVQDGTSSFTGNTTRLQYNNIVLPDFQGILAFDHPTNSDISIQFTPLAFRR
ncbi:MAG TPA: hypothetical protein VLJ11_01535 [Bryobacteraceae bacterium]|nr:hypothetical protein [Bryobacteraceae bacterium]